MKYILILNCGTSSLKYGLFEKESSFRACSGVVERVGIKGSIIRHKPAGMAEFLYENDCSDHTAAINLILKTLLGQINPEYRLLKDINDIKAAGHRVLHGGEAFTKSVLIDEKVYSKIVEMIKFGPLHNPANLAGINAIKNLIPKLPQVAVFDTAFFQSLPRKAYLYGVPYKWYKDYGIRKYGFHGSSHLYLTKRAAAVLGKKKNEVNLISLHIGNGISLTAVRNGEAVEHSMGISPLDGAMMGTRSGSIDPAIIPFICSTEQRSPEDVVNIDLNKKSGLFGFTGFTDMRDILKNMEQGDENCSLAYEIYCYKIRHFLGAYLAVLDYDVDTLVFAGGVGENSARIRSDILSGFKKVGILLDREKNNTWQNKGKEFEISEKKSNIKIYVIPTDEEIVIFEDIIGILNGVYDIHNRFTYSFEKKTR